MPKKVNVIKAAETGNLAVLSEWLAKGGNPNAKDEQGLAVIHSAAYRGQAEAVKLLIDHGAEVNVSNQIGYTPLMVASREGYSIDTVRLLLDAGAQVNAATVEGRTALMVTCDNISDGKMAQYLLSRGADVNAKDHSGITALMNAAWRGSVNAVREFILAGAEINSTGTDGKTALASARERGHEDVADLLIAHGAK